MYSYEQILGRMLSAVRTDVDKRQGSIIYDALAPAAAELATMYIELDIRDRQSYLMSATGDSLDKRAADHGVTRYPASYAIRIGWMSLDNGDPMDIPIGVRFSTPNEKKGIVYTAIERIAPGTFALKCEEAGSIGNDYTGDLLPLSYINLLGTAYMEGTITPARDTETDTPFRERVLEVINRKSFGGNRADYREKVRAIQGVGELQIYPVWAGGGTVKLSVVDAQFNIITAEFQQKIAQEIDPENNSGAGLGIAPIGHKVTVVTPSELEINVSAVVSLSIGAQIEIVQEAIAEQVQLYIDEVRRSWAKADALGAYHSSVYTARVIAAILDADGVENAQDVTINGQTADIVLIQTAQTQQIPKLGRVSLNGATTLSSMVLQRNRRISADNEAGATGI